MSEEIERVLEAITELGRRISAIEDHLQRGGPERKKTVWELTRMMEAKEKEAQALKNSSSSEVAMGTQWDSPELRQEYIRLRREVKSLNHQIASMTP